MLDAFYTPPDIADRLVGDGGFPCPDVCADTACGGGNLLAAAGAAYPRTVCVGTDKDGRAIRQLRKHRPNWILSVADILDVRSRSRATALQAGSCDLLLLNPPFSMNGRKFVSIDFDGHALRTSVAMAHILKSVDVMKPRFGILAVVPESLLFSQIDAEARRVLGNRFQLEVMSSLKAATFSGARVHTCLVRMAQPCERHEVVLPRASTSVRPVVNEIDVVRGGLPMFERKPDRNGLPLIHTTSLPNLSPPNIRKLGRVMAIGRGRTSGCVVLLSRVGQPFATPALRLSDSVQLSDCVVSLQFQSMAEARLFRGWLDQQWIKFCGLYRGTAARYLTLEGLRDFLLEAAWEVKLAETRGVRAVKSARS